MSIHPSFYPVQSFIFQVNITIHASVCLTASLHTGFPTVHLHPINLATYRPPTYLLTTYHPSTYLTTCYPHTYLRTSLLTPFNHLLSYYYLPTYLPTHPPTHLRTYVPSCLPACLPSCLPTYLPTYLLCRLKFSNYIGVFLVLYGNVYSMCLSPI